MKYLILLLLLLSCNKTPNNSLEEKKSPIKEFDFINGKNIMQHVKWQLSLNPRHANSKASKNFASSLAEYATTRNLDATIDTWTETFQQQEITFNNVYVTSKGTSDEFIVFATHFDTKKIPNIPEFQGANDGASSTAVLMEMINVLDKVNRDKYYTIVFAFFDGEESFNKYNVYCHNNYDSTKEQDGLFGSRHYVQQLKENNKLNLCKAMVLLDLVGHKDFKLGLYEKVDYLTDFTFDIIKQLNYEKFFVNQKNTVLDDHIPFQYENIPALNIIDNNFSTSSYWHTAKDTINILSEESLYKTTQIALHLLLKLCKNKNL